MNADLLIVVVLYRVSWRDIRWLAQVPETVPVFLYDNSPTAQVVPDRFYYHHDPLNSGVSKAYNTGFSLGMQLQVRAVLLLDHDSAFAAGMLQVYRDHLCRHGDQFLYAPVMRRGDTIYSPARAGFWRNKPLRGQVDRLPALFPLAGFAFINSGLLIPLALIQQIGGYNAHIRLDFSDTYFFEQYARHQSALILLPLSMSHQLSGDLGRDKPRELDRFQSYCEGAAVFMQTTARPHRLRRLVLARALRLVLKYRTLKPLQTMRTFFRRADRA